MSQTFKTCSEEETIERGVEFARQLQRGDVVALTGDLGTGKTRFIQGICKGLGVQEHVASPTFTIVNQYDAHGIIVYHCDFYRVHSVADIRDVGFEEYVSSGGICLIEWAEKAHQLLPAQRYDVHLRLGNDEQIREITIEKIVEVEV
ncbi:MAG: tRNA (adenosine(37)-N6)-threonylcarbamoyltransferase complex ATPase subunit type 1 TsaE [Ignavibacteriae bacterium]|nr:tRNA (adenosine(37)-N6)-threonylcarbamoyltransferase complex ATPase subunit type 1 TsaE [Ignavibacteriota bacterium]